MPSLVCSSDKFASGDVTETFKQCITVVEKKVRNLEKRKAKLDLYRTEKAKLNEDQKEALAKYDAVLQNLDFARELQKQFQTMLVESTNILHKQDKRDRYERHQQETARFATMLQYQTVLSGLSRSSVRSDFLQGRRGAVVLTEQSLQQLNELKQLIQHPEDLSDSGKVEVVVDHITAVLEGKDSAVAGTTYKNLHDILQQVLHCGYFSHPLQDSNAEDSCGQMDHLSFGTISSLTSDEHSKPASLISSPPSPLSCHSTSSASRSVHMTAAEPAEATIAEDEAKNTNDQPTTNESVPVVSQNNENMVEFSFTFDTDDHVQATVPVCLDKDIQEVVSGFESHFNFLQESLVDSEVWRSNDSQSLGLATTTSVYSSTCTSCPPDNICHLPVSSASYIDSSCYTTSVCNEKSLPLSVNNCDMTNSEVHYTHRNAECSSVDVSDVTFTSPFDVADQSVVSYPSQYSTQLMTTMPYIPPAIVPDPYFTQQNIDFSHQVAYTTAFGPVMSTYTEPLMADSQLSSVPCVYPDAMAAYPDEGIQDVAYFQGPEIYADPYQSENGLVAMSACEPLIPVSYDNTESSGLNPNASEFHSRFTSPLVECEVAHVDHCNEENNEMIETSEHADFNECPEDCGQFGFRGRGRGFHGAPRGGRYNHNRGGGFVRHRNYQRDGYSSDYYNSSWRGNRGRGMYNARGGNRGYGRNVHQEVRE